MSHGRAAVCLLIFGGVAAAQQYIISTVVGGAPPPTPIAATSASLIWLGNVATDTSGNAYFVTAVQDGTDL